MKQYVIIGNGVAAVSCIEGIRSVDPDGAITVLSKENHPVYCRPLISYYLEGKTDLERMKYRKNDFYEANGVRVCYGAEAISIDPIAKTVVLSDGSTLPYDALCCATGSLPFVPPFVGLEQVEHPYSFLTLDDALALEQAVTPDSNVLIVGAGLIGLKCAEGLCHRAKSITVCDLADRVLSSILDAPSAAIVQKQLEAAGITLCLSDSAKEFSQHEALLQSGKRVPFDVLVLAVGVRANTSLIQAAGGKVNRGILVNERMETSLPNIYAAGDCTEGMDASLGAPRVLALMPNANFQGFTAGVNMAGGERTLTNAIPMNAIGFFGLHIMTAGTAFSAEQGGSSWEQPGDGAVKKLFFKDDLLTGFMLVGNCERTGIYTALIREQTPLSTIDFNKLKEVPSAMIYSKEHRRTMYGGAVK